MEQGLCRRRGTGGRSGGSAGREESGAWSDAATGHRRAAGGRAGGKHPKSTRKFSFHPSCSCKGSLSSAVQMPHGALDEAVVPGSDLLGREATLPSLSGGGTAGWSIWPKVDVIPQESSAGEPRGASLPLLLPLKVPSYPQAGGRLRPAQGEFIFLCHVGENGSLHI